MTPDTRFTRHTKYSASDGTYEIACEAVDKWSALHPNIRLNLNEWADLRECIQGAILDAMEPR